MIAREKNAKVSNYFCLIDLSSKLKKNDYYVR